MADKHSIRNQVIAGLIITSLAAAGGWVTGLLGMIWPAIEDAARCLWGWSTIPITLPLWLLILAGAAVLLMLRAPWKTKATRSATPSPAGPPPQLRPEHLSPTSRAILMAFVAHDGRVLDIDNIKYAVDVPMSHFREALRQLSDGNIIFHHTDVLGRTKIGLTAKGDQFIIEFGGDI